MGYESKNYHLMNVYCILYVIYFMNPCGPVDVKWKCIDSKWLPNEPSYENEMWFCPVLESWEKPCWNTKTIDFCKTLM